VITLTGLTTWAGCMVLLPAPLAARIFLVAPLVIVPGLLARFPRRRWIGGLAGWPAFGAAVGLVVAFGLEPGAAAAGLTVPWLLVTVIGLASAIAHGLPRLPGILHPKQATELGIDTALGFLAVGAAFIAFDRLGLRPLDFPATIILLTGVHFHVAGFGLLALAALLARDRPVIGVGVLGLAVGMPLTAAGFVFDSPALGAGGGLVVGLAGIGVGLALLAGPGAGPGRWLRAVAGLAFLGGMPLGIAWAIASALGAPFLDLEMMVRTHGLLNAGGVVLASVAPDRP
jgi:hypothetical protein